MAFSGVTVVVALASLWVIDNQGIRSVALGAITVVTVSVVTAVALLPVPVRSLGDRAVRPGRIRSLTGMARAALARRGRPGSAGFWSRWARTVMAHPVAAITGSLAILLVLSLPLPPEVICTLPASPWMARFIRPIRHVAWLSSCP